MFFIDKYNSKIEFNTILHSDIIEQLKKISKDFTIPNIIFYGPSGSGKKTIINSLLEMIYDSDVNKLSEVVYNVTGSGNIVSEIIVKQSNYHIVIEPNNNNFDRYLIQDIVKEYAKRTPFNIFKTNIMFRTVLINNVNKLSYYAQTSMRRTMEKYSKNCRFILCSDSLSKVLDPLKSRCLSIRVNRPTDIELTYFLMEIIINENMKLNLNEIIKIIKLANGNIRELLWLIEMKKYKLSLINSYNNCINKIIKYIEMKKTGNLDIILNLMYTMLITNISGSQIIKDIIIRLGYSENINYELKYQIFHIGAKYEKRLIQGRREIIHLKSFILHVFFILIDSAKINNDT